MGKAIGGLLASLILIDLGVSAIKGQAVFYRAYPLLGWVGYPLACLGVCFAILSIRWLFIIRRRKEDPAYRLKDPEYTDEDVKRAKEELNAIHIREHGRPLEEMEDAETHVEKRHWGRQILLRPWQFALGVFLVCFGVYTARNPYGVSEALLFGAGFVGLGLYLCYLTFKKN